jgi:hypothetical protein
MDVIKDTCRKVEQWLGQCANPVVLWSGGKDSTAMLHLIRYEVGANLPVIQWREPRFRSRYAFSDRLANAWDLEMYDYAPMDYMLTDGFDIETGAPRFDFVKLYQFGQKALALCLGTEEPKADELASGRYLCGLDALRRPTGTFNFPWDGAFHGQKSADVDLIKGQVPLAVDALVQAGSGLANAPIRSSFGRAARTARRCCTSSATRSAPTCRSSSGASPGSVAATPSATGWPMRGTWRCMTTLRWTTC